MNDKSEMYERIKNHIKELILSGELLEGAKIPSESELAAQFRVNRNCPRRVLRELEIEGYVVRSQGKRTTVAPASSRKHALTVNKVPVLALILPSYTMFLHKSISDGFLTYTSGQEIQSTVFVFILDEQEECQLLMRLPETGISGVAFVPQHNSPNTLQAVETLQKRHIPIVQLERYIKGTATDYVGSDNKEMMHYLTSELINKGHRKIAYIAVVDNEFNDNDRFSGFRCALNDHGILLSDDYVKRIDLTYSFSVRTTLKDLMERPDFPTAMVCTHDLLAWRILQELDRLGYRVPEQVELAAIEEVLFPPTNHFPMISVQHQGNELGSSAAEMLLMRLYDPLLPTSKKFLEPSPIL